LRYEFKPSFRRSTRTLNQEQIGQIKTACLAFLELLETKTPLPAGTGLKRLRNNFWEIRQGIRNRILFRWEGDLIEFILAGDHDSIKNFLKNL